MNAPSLSYSIRAARPYDFRWATSCPECGASTEFLCDTRRVYTCGALYDRFALTHPHGRAT